MTNQTLKQFSEVREERAKAILENGNPEKLDDNTYLVSSSDNKMKCMVTHFDSYSCTCKDYELRCKGKKSLL